MELNRLLFATVILSVTTTVSNAENKEQSRWSRQISSYVSDISDWIPLAAPTDKLQGREQPMKRQVAQPRILTEPMPVFPKPTGFNQDAFPGRQYFNGPNHKQLYLQSVPSAPQNFLTDQGFGQTIKFGLSQPNFPLSQGFVGQSFGFESVPQFKQNLVNPNNFHKSTLPLSLQAKPFVNLHTINTPKSEAPKFVDGYRVENGTRNFNSALKTQPQSLQKLKMEPQNPQILHRNNNHPKVEREEVQLLYVPVESLNRGQFNFGNPLESAQIVNSDFFNSPIQKPTASKPAFATEFGRIQNKPMENFSFGPDFYSQLNSQVHLFDQTPKYSTVSSPIPTAPPTTPKPKKLKPHQPPLAVFLTQESKKGNIVKVSDVLLSLKNAKTIAVLDSVSPEYSPKVFIGPSSLKSPENYVKFELPYLSNIEHSDRKLRQLPFFVAPLSYNTPEGFAKIPFPSPHVGSVIINSQIKDSQNPESPIASVIPNSYTPSSLSYNKEVKQTTPILPTFTYFSTLPPKTNSPANNFQSTYYSFEPQTVTSVKPPKLEDESIFTAPPKRPVSYYVTNNRPAFNELQNYLNFQSQRPVQNPYENLNKQKNVHHSTEIKTIITTPTPVTTKSTTMSMSTYPNQLLETHNPYSINQAFHLSTPLDYQNYFEEYKESVVTPGNNQLSVTNTPNQSNMKANFETTSSPYLQNYNSQIHYESEQINSPFPSFSTNTNASLAEFEKEITIKHAVPGMEQTESLSDNQNPLQESFNKTSVSDLDTDIVQSNRSPVIYNSYESNSNEHQGFAKETSSSTTTTTTTTTRRSPPLRTRSRPRYTTPRTESKESTTRTAVTRRPLRERRPLPQRTKYEPNKVTTEKASKSSTENSNESSTKYSRTRTRGRVHYKPSEDEELYELKKHKSTKKENDLAYQRDVLHQNYPVTLMERMSTADIESATEPLPSVYSEKDGRDKELDSDAYDNEQAYSAEQTYFSGHSINSQLTDTGTPTFPSRSVETETEPPAYVPRIISSKNEEYYFHPRSSTSQIETITSSTSSSSHSEQGINKSTPKIESSSVTFEPTTPDSYQFTSRYTTIQNERFETESTVEISSTKPDLDLNNLGHNRQLTNNENNEEKVNNDFSAEFKPSYTNTIKTYPGQNQYHVPSSESPIDEVTNNQGKPDTKRKLLQPITFRPAFNRRQTTMRIEEIEADLKTKPVHARLEQSQRHPIYRPESVEYTSTTSLPEISSKRAHYRRRRPTNSYSTTSTEASTVARKTIQNAKSRFRGRRPVERTTEKPELQTEITSTTSKVVPINRYNHRNRLSERYNRRQSTTKAADDQTAEDQDSNYSINSPRYVAPEEKYTENGNWSPNLAIENFKPYNPNTIQDEAKSATTERRPLESDESAMDIITARNDYDDILISVTPASNQLNKKIPEIPPTLEAFVEQNKNFQNVSNSSMSSFESMLEEVMKSLEEQDENEYTSNVMKHKGGEIGEIPPEETVTSTAKSTPHQQEPTTTDFNLEENNPADGQNKEVKNRRRGYWKKVKVRPVTTESIEVAESQFYSHTVNHLGDKVLKAYNKHKEKNSFDNPKPTVTTYRPNFSVHRDLEEVDTKETEDTTDSFQTTENFYPDIPDELKADTLMDTTIWDSYETTSIPDITRIIPKQSIAQTNVSPGDLDLGTGSPEPTMEDKYNTPPSESSNDSFSLLDRSDSFSGIMDYLFGMTSEDSEKPENDNGYSEESTKNIDSKDQSVAEISKEAVTYEGKNNVTTTESSFVPAEITTLTTDVQTTKSIEISSNSEPNATKNVNEISKENVSRNETVTQDNDSFNIKTVESSSVSSFWDPSNVVSTSMSTEISHETEICFRGKCIKTSNIML